MNPDLFAGTDAADETQLCDQLGDVAKRERFKVHRDSFVTDRDFAYLAARGVELVRIPVPFFVFGGHEPYVGCVDHLDRGFRWAQKHGIQVLLDLHTVPGSQNGFDNGGLQGVCKFHQDPANVEVALSVLEGLAARYRDHGNLWGIEVLNEPVSQAIWDGFDVPGRYPPADPEAAQGSEPVPTDFLKGFYRNAYERIREQAPDLRIVFHDGFRIEEWFGFFTEPDFVDVVVDTHPYLMMHTATRGDLDLDDYLEIVADDFAGTVREASRHFPVMVGEWTVDTASEKAAALDRDERREFHRRVWAAQVEAFEPVVAWTYWSYKLLDDTPASDCWDMGKAIELGFIPSNLASQTD
jgi:glucan 1,3-beta-glucosidase